MFNNKTIRITGGTKSFGRQYVRMIPMAYQTVWRIPPLRNFKGG